MSTSCVSIRVAIIGDPTGDDVDEVGLEVMTILLATKFIPNLVT